MDAAMHGLRSGMRSSLLDSYLITGNKALTINREIGMSRGDVRETLEILEMIRYNVWLEMSIVKAGSPTWTGMMCEGVC